MTALDLSIVDIGVNAFFVVIVVTDLPLVL